MTDTETAAAIDALAHRLRLRDEAMRDGGDYADPEPFAAEYVTAMRGYGWRPTPAKATAPPKHSPPAAADGSRDDMLARARARCDEATAVRRAQENAEGAA